MVERDAGPSRTPFALHSGWTGSPEVQRKRGRGRGPGAEALGSAEEVGGDVVEEAGGERERLDVDAFVVAVEA